MSDILKQRLVGALILVALGVIFWPIVFLQPDNETALHRQPAQAQSIATVVAVEDVAVQPSLAASDNVVVASGSALEVTPGRVPSDDEPEPSARETLTMDSDGMPLAWTLQVITVSSADKAEELRKRLLDMKHQAYIVTVRSNGKKLYRVSIGPKFERAELDTLQASINAQFEVSSIVARYIP